MPYRIAVISLVLFTGIFSATGDTRIAKWKNDCAGALSFSFDDSYPSHAEIAVPAFAERNLTGTFFVVPGKGDYTAHKQVWEYYVPRHGQELANHTWTHASVSTYDEVVKEIRDPAQVILDAYPADRSPLMAFAQGGGTSWPVTAAEKDALLAQYHCIKRGVAPKNYSIRTDNGHDVPYLISKAQEAIDGKTWRSLYTHGITETGVGYLSLKKADFLAFLDWLDANRDQVWNGGFIKIYQYDQERDNSSVSTPAVSGSSISFDLTTTLDTLLYEVPLTLVTEVPSGWDLCRITSGSHTGYARASGGSVMYDVRPNLGTVTVTSVSIPAVSSVSGPDSVYEGQQVMLIASTVTDGACTWQWKKDGSAISGADAETLVIADAASSDAGSYTCTASGGGNSHTGPAHALRVITPALQTLPVWEAETAYLRGPFQDKGSYLYHAPPFPALQPEGEVGKASWFFNVTQAGTYQVEAYMLAYREGYRTVFVDIDKDPVDNTMAWDVDITSGFEWRTASWRGTGTVSSNEIIPKTWDLDAGVHELVIVGGDQKIRLDSIKVSLVSAGIEPVRETAVSNISGGIYQRFDASGSRIGAGTLPRGIYFDYDPERNLVIKRMHLR